MVGGWSACVSAQVALEVVAGDPTDTVEVGAVGACCALWSLAVGNDARVARQGARLRSSDDFLDDSRVAVPTEHEPSLDVRLLGHDAAPRRFISMILSSHPPVPPLSLLSSTLPTSRGVPVRTSTDSSRLV